MCPKFLFELESHIPGYTICWSRPTAAQAFRRFRRAADDAPIGDRIWSETLQHAEGQDPARVEVMFSRIAVLLEILIDRRGWPGTIRGFG
jgi:hypothetical protein